MVRKLAAYALAVSSFMVAGQLLAAGTFTMKIGSEFRSEYEYYNDGLNEDNENATSKFSLNFLKVKLYGNVGQSTTFNFLLTTNGQAAGDIDPSGGGISLIEFAYLTHSINDMFALRVGKNYLNFGGFERKRQNYKNIYFSPAVTGAYNKLSGYVAEGHLSFGDAGKVVVQLATDGRNGPATDAADTMKQPSVYLEYMGNFGGVKALAQYAMFDHNNGMSWGIGLGTTMMNFDVALDYSMQTVDQNADDSNTASNLVLHAAYTMNGWMPWFTFNWFDVDQENDVEANSAVGTYDDNKIGWAVGVSCADSSSAFHPYLAVVGNGGDFTVGTEEESLSDLAVKVGVTSEF